MTPKQSHTRIDKSTLDQLKHDLAALTDPVSKPTLIRVETHLSELDPLAWLNGQTAAQRLFWSDREHAFCVAGVGVAMEFQAQTLGDYATLFEQMRAPLSASFPALRFYGGLRFDAVAEVDERWSAFGAYRFVVPEVELGLKGNRCYLAWNTLLNAGESGASRIDQLEAAFQNVSFPEEQVCVELPPTLTREDRPAEEDWGAMVDLTLQAIEEGRVQKTILARETNYQFEGALDPISLLRSLSESTTYSFHFCFQPEEGVAFLGASPERLYKRVNTYLQSEALAGTRPRGETPEEDLNLGQDLLASEKDRREHQFVVDSISEVFAQFCRAIRGDDHVELLVLRNCQHLLSRIEGMLEKTDSDARLLSLLHPTPAVGGVPVEKALELIRELEPFDRGWYAAPVGWVGFDSTEFAVAIRSGLAIQDKLSLYTGAGIVTGSTADGEWDEIDNKMTSFTDVLSPAEVSRSRSGLAS